MHSMRISKKEEERKNYQPSPKGKGFIEDSE
jgi:hypothetical protein